MSKIIEIKEENNELSIINEETKIICGNSNYKLKFSLSSDWKNANNKAVIFSICGQRFIVSMEGEECDVPVINKSGILIVSLIAGADDNQLATTGIKIELIDTPANGDFSEFNPLRNDLTTLLDSINKIENGNITVKQAENCNISNFAKNVSNTNIIINGDFRINQREQLSYTGSGKYTVDRWRLHSAGTLIVNENGTITYTISSSNWAGLNYYIDKPSFLSNKTVTLSLKGSSTAGMWSSVYHKGSSIGGSYTRTVGEFYLTSTFTFGEVLDTDTITIRLTTRNTDMPAGIENNTFTLEFVKLEIGEEATSFIPRPYEEELAICKRYYQKIVNVSFAPNSDYASCSTINYPVEMRTKPSSKVYPANINGEIISYNEKCIYDIANNTEVNTTQNGNYATTTQIAVSGGGKLTANKQYGYAIILDAEIY